MKTFSKLWILKIFVVTTACLALAVSGCKKEEGGSPAAGTNPSAKKLKLAFVSNNAATFWTIARAGCQDAAI